LIVLAHHDLKLFRVSQHPFLICLVVVHLERVVHLPMRLAPSNLSLPPIAMDMAQHAFFSQKERAHEQ
jgi:hypothetical protein